MKFMGRYYKTTSCSQRKFLFEVWQETGNVSEACRRARVSRATFYYWKPRFKEAGYAGLEKPQSHAPANPRKTSREIIEQVVAFKKAHPHWGRHRIAGELMKENNWERVVSASTVRRILLAEGLMAASRNKPAKRKAEPEVRHAEKQGQTVNVDLCFVPAEHETTVDLPTVSGSSGKLKICKPKAQENERQWPGRVFEQTDCSYEEAMDAYVAARTDDQSGAKTIPEPSTEEEAIKAKKKKLKEQEEQLRIERRKVREQRKQEDEVWRRLKKQRREAKKVRKQVSKEKRRAQRAEEQARKEERKAQNKIRKEQLEVRKKEDQKWRDQRKEIREQKENLPVITAWIAILVIVDNCTRQCLGLPMFTAGAHVSADMVVEALKELLPGELQYLIADRGVHFTSKALEQLARDKGFKRVFLAPHRPQSNGIAERHVRTLKEWLLTRSWETSEELSALLVEFAEHYNDRPHQGKELEGLSPNEYANRLAA
jgi:transposase InsO family protein